jgi:ribonucleoside-diphosphate reductase alpha chain
VWFNIGVPGTPQQASACFILSVDDSMPSIKDWWANEALIFQGGSGAGANLSRLRGSVEPIGGSATPARDR